MIGVYNFPDKIDVYLRGGVLVRGFTLIDSGGFNDSSDLHLDNS